MNEETRSTTLRDFTNVTFVFDGTSISTLVDDNVLVLYAQGDIVNLPALDERDGELVFVYYPVVAISDFVAYPALEKIGRSVTGDLDDAITTLEDAIKGGLPPGTDSELLTQIEESVENMKPTITPLDNEEGSADDTATLSE